MNRTAIEWTDYTWNPITGCNRGCPHCYARRMAYRLKGRYGYPEDNPFKVTFHPDRLNEPSQVKKPSRIFTCSMGEAFDKDSKYGWLDLIFAEMRRCPQHIFQLLTQCSELLWQFEFPKNCHVGVTVKRNDETYRIRDLLSIRTTYLHEPPEVLFASFEPLHEDLLADLHGLDWIIIGAETGTRKKTFKDAWVDRLVYEALTLEIPIFMKPNLRKQGYNGVNWYQQFPTEKRKEGVKNRK